MTNEDIKQEIEIAKAQLDKLKEKLLINEKLELKCNNYYINGDGYVSWVNISEKSSRLGGTRATKELAEIASKNMVTRNKLEAWVHERQGDSTGSKIINRISDGEYIATEAIGYYSVQGAVYMKKKTAEWICERLNDGRISLED